MTSCPGASRRVLSALLWLLHALVTGLVALSLASHRLLLTLRHLATGRDLHLDPAQLQGLAKRPRHIAFLVLEREIHYPDLARLVVWSLEAGVRLVSLYDPRGRLKAHQPEVLEELGKQCAAAPGLQGNLALQWRPHTAAGGGERAVIVGPEGGSSYPDPWGRGAGTLLGRAEGAELVTVSLLGPEDGKGDLVRAARDIAASVAAGEVGPSQVTEEMVAAELASNKGLPDPCLAVRLGSTASTAGFLPWQLRLTELHGLPSHRGLLPGQLEQVLRSCRAARESARDMVVEERGESGEESSEEETEAEESVKEKAEDGSSSDEESEDDEDKKDFLRDEATAIKKKLTAEEMKLRKKEKNKLKRKKQTQKRQGKRKIQGVNEESLDVELGAPEEKKKKFYNPDSAKNQRTAEEIVKFKKRHKDKLRKEKKKGAKADPKIIAKAKADKLRKEKKAGAVKGNPETIAKA